MEKQKVSLEVARHVLWHFGDRNNGLEPGSFVSRLLVTISAADTDNRDKLALGFPEHVYAMRVVQNEFWGLDWLQGIAKRSVAPADGLDLFEAAAEAAPELIACMAHEGEPHEQNRECVFPHPPVVVVAS